jgi:hypothetical protein
MIRKNTAAAIVGRSGPIMKSGVFHVSFQGYGGTVEVFVYESDLSYTKKNQDPQGVNINAYLDVETYESSEIENDSDVKDAFEKAASRVLGVPVELTGHWYEAQETRSFEKHMRNTLLPRGHFRIAVGSKKAKTPRANRREMRVAQQGGMQKNSVSALTIINPEDELSTPGSLDLRTLGIGAAIGVAGIAIIMQVKKSMQSSTPVTQPAVGSDSSTISSLGAVVLAGVIGLYVWRAYFSPKQAQEDILGNPRSSKKSRGSGYFVLVVGTSEVYPKPGSSSYPGGYSLKTAQDFARIGSQTGAPRKVLRGSSNGIVVRKYVDGKRVWPKTQAQASSLRPAERPSKLRKSA